MPQDTPTPDYSSFALSGPGADTRYRDPAYSVFAQRERDAEELARRRELQMQIDAAMAQLKASGGSQESLVKLQGLLAAKENLQNRTWQTGEAGAERAFTGEQAGLGRTFEANEAEKSRGFTGGQGQAAREWQTGQAEADRAFREGQTAAQFTDIGKERSWQSQEAEKERSARLGGQLTGAVLGGQQAGQENQWAGAREALTRQTQQQEAEAQRKAVQAEAAANRDAAMAAQAREQQFAKERDAAATEAARGSVLEAQKWAREQAMTSLQNTTVDRQNAAAEEERLRRLEEERALRGLAARANYRLI